MMARVLVVEDNLPLAEGIAYNLRHEGHDARVAEDGRAGLADVHASEHARALVQSEVDAVNRGLAKWEQVKRFQLLPEPWTIEDGALTPTLKVKRRVVNERHRALIESMYA